MHRWAAAHTRLALNALARVVWQATLIALYLFGHLTQMQARATHWPLSPQPSWLRPLLSTSQRRAGPCNSSGTSKCRSRYPGAHVWGASSSTAQHN